MIDPIYRELLDRTQQQLDAARSCLERGLVPASLLNVAVAEHTLAHYQRLATTPPAAVAASPKSPAPCSLNPAPNSP